LDWLEDMSNRLTGVDGFALHIYGDPSISGDRPLWNLRLISQAAILQAGMNSK
jgi:hypothetical protein